MNGYTAEEAMELNHGRLPKTEAAPYGNMVFAVRRDGNEQLAGFLTITRDMNARRNLEPQFTELLECAPNAITITQPDCLILASNAKTATLFGYPATELEGRPMDALVPIAAPASVRDPASVLLGLRKYGTPFPIEIRRSYVDTTDGTVLVSAVPDVTTRLHGEHMGSGMDRWLHGILESAPDAMRIRDHQGVISLANAQTQRMFGHSRANLIGKPVE